MNTANKKTALFSLFDQENAVLYAKGLADMGWKIIASRETSGLLNKNGIRTQDISDYLAVDGPYPFPPTLHPQIELALTTDKTKPVDLVYITTYPLSKGNDVGGHTLLGLAAKGKRIVVGDKEDMADVVKRLKTNNNEIDSLLRQKLIDRAYAKIIKHYLSLLGGLKDADAIRIMPLLNGENPYQVPADFFNTDTKDLLSLGNFKQISGVPPCFTNMADFDCILKIVCSLCEAFKMHCGKIPYVTIAAKHGNPCGLAVDWKHDETTIKNALYGNPTAIWGGEVITNFPISKKLAKKLLSSKQREKLLGNPNWMLDLIAAPAFDKEAVNILGKNKNRKLFENKVLKKPHSSDAIWSHRAVRGGFLRQPPNSYVLNIKESGRDFTMPKPVYLDSLFIAWATAWFSNHGGNEIAIAKDRRLLAAGGGPSTISACHTVMARARQCNHNTDGSVFAANAFLPFSDAAMELTKAGCIYGVLPDGGKNADLVKNYFKKHKVNIFYLPEQYRGFNRH